jgi:hypothetical protein
LLLLGIGYSFAFREIVSSFALLKSVIFARHHSGE